MDKIKGIQEGPPIFVETLMTIEEWKERLKKYLTSHLKEPTPLSNFDIKEFKWRWRMGGTLSTEEVTIINLRLDKLKKEAGI